MRSGTMASGAVWSLGTMSGTSLDGVDAAMVLTDGERIIDFGPTAYRPYSAAEQAVIRAAFGLWPADNADSDAAIKAAAEIVETAHAEVMSRFSGAEIAGFHGQTLAHDPQGRGTHQAGDGDLLARTLGLPVVWDFRSADVRMGGQGAPLAPFFHFACARHIGADQPLAMLNLGGVGNITWIDPRHTAPEHAGALLAFDTGPANAPLNDLMQRLTGTPQDKGGAFAATGTADQATIDRFLSHPYFYRMPPKSLDRNDFHAALDVVDLSDADAAATLTAAIAASVARGAEHFPTPISRLLVTGGGRHNATIMAELSTRLRLDAEAVESAGLDGDMLEAQAFAFLAVRVARGLPTSGPMTTGVPALVGGGKISKPD